MSKWQGMQKQPNIKLRDLLKIESAKTHKLSELSKTEQNRLVKLNYMPELLTLKHVWFTVKGRKVTTIVTTV